MSCGVSQKFRDIYEIIIHNICKNTFYLKKIYLKTFLEIIINNVQSHVFKVQG